MNICLEGTTSLTVRMANIVAGSGAFSCNVTSSCHIKTLSEIKIWQYADGLPAVKRFSFKDSNLTTL